MAHEMAHSSLGHASHARLNFDSHECASNENATWLEEVEADYLAVQLLNRVTDLRSACSATMITNNGLIRVGEPLDHCDANAFAPGLRAAPEFYFLARQISREACAIASAKQEPPDEAERGLLTFAQTCKESPSCDFLRDTKNLPATLKNRQGHPLPAIRREFARIWMDDPDLIGFSNPISSITNSLMRNSLLLWNRAKVNLGESIPK